MTSRRTAARRAVITAGALLALIAFAVSWVSQPFVFAASDVTGSVMSAEKLRDDVKKLTVEWPERNYDHREELDKAAEWIATELRATSGTVSEQVFDHEGKPFKNILASFGPLTDEVIVVGAHYDANPGTPGADDNASGLAGLLELARKLDGKALPTRVILVAFSLEETTRGRALNGSREYAAELKKSGTRVRAMFSLEMLGYYSDEEGSQRFPLGVLGYVYPTTGNYLVIVGEISAAGLVRDVKSGYSGSGATLPIRSINAPRSIPGIGSSDHASFWNAGYPAVMITDSAYYRNRRYHKAEDTWDTLDYARMAEAVRGVHGAVLHLAKK